MFSPLFHRLQGLCLHASTARRAVRTTPSLLIDALPPLGSVLYVPMHPHPSAAWSMPPGVLVDTMRLVPLLQARWLVAACTITVDGPSEWIECLDRDGHRCARLYLLPDTDYLAWDAWLGRGDVGSAPDSWARRPRPAGAQLLCFNRRRLACLEVLGSEAAMQVSTLSRQLAGRMARADALPWSMQTDG
jgi:hypothetical protein